MNSQGKSDPSDKDEDKDEDKNGVKEEIVQRFRCLSLYESHPSEAVLLSEIIKKCQSGVHDFYPHVAELSENKEYRKTFYQVLKSKMTESDVELNGWEWKQNNYVLKTNQLMRLVYQTSIHQFHETVLSYYQRLRGELYEEGTFNEKAGFNACQATCWDLFTDRTEQSPIIVDEKHGEYLVWNDAELWTKEEWDKRDVDKKALAWRGSSWLGHKIQWYYQKEKSEEILQGFPQQLSQLLFSKIETLAQYHQGLSDYYLKQRKENQLLHLKPWQSYIACLCEFLPPYEYTEGKDVMRLPVHTAGGSGEPLLWQGILDSHIHMLMRQLLMDGWLCLWPDERCENLYLHPSSLAMLYWAARHARKPYTATPKEFIKNYHWNEKWFGGRIAGSM